MPGICFSIWEYFVNDHCYFNIQGAILTDKLRRWRGVSMRSVHRQAMHRALADARCIFRCEQMDGANIKSTRTIRKLLAKHASIFLSTCTNNTLDPMLVAGKIVVCTIAMNTDARPDKAHEVERAGGAGMILVDPVAVDIGFQFVVPSALIGPQEARVLQAYLASSSNPVATISRTSTVLKTQPAPSTQTPDIIKPDITAPGLNILAKWSPVAVGATAGRPVNYNIISGTSMSCPHVAGAAAIIKARRPKWSVAAIKSALMTTATVMDNSGNTIVRYPNGSPATPFDYGSWHLNPFPAIHPGLVYDYDLSDMIDFLSSTSASPAQLRNLTSKAIKHRNRTVAAYDLNYPSIAVSSVAGNMSVYRTVTNCHGGSWAYNVSIKNPTGVDVQVVPDELSFDRVGEKKSFRVDIIPSRVSNGSFVFGAVTWRDGTHTVRSPIALNVVSV